MSQTKDPNEVANTFQVRIHYAGIIWDPSCFREWLFFITHLSPDHRGGNPLMKNLRETYENLPSPLKNPSAVASLRGNIYEEKILELIKSKAKTSKKTISKEEAEKILKAENEKQMKEHSHNNDHDDTEEKTLSGKDQTKKKTKSTSKKTTKAKKVSKK